TLHLMGRSLASAKCLTDCVLLVIPAAAFMAMKEALVMHENNKRYVLGQVISGMNRPVDSEKVHPSIFFHRAVHHKGHVFLSQGHDAFSVQPMFWVIATGSVSFTRKKDRPTRHQDHGIAEIVDCLGAGKVFGTLPQASIEPFTVTVSEGPCELYF
ncbi:unnamed protein product, partial [Polarella glacialis]